MVGDTELDSPPRGKASPRAKSPPARSGLGTGNDQGMDQVFGALSSGIRRSVLDLVRAAPGCSVGSVCGQFSISRIAVLKHLRILERSGLLTSTKEGRVRHLYFNLVPIQRIYDRWADEYGAHWARHLAGLKQAVETKGSSR